MEFSAKEIASVVGGTLEGDGAVRVRSFAGIERAKAGQMSFYANPKYEKYVAGCRASVLLVGNDFRPATPLPATLIRVPDVYSALSLLLSWVGARKKAVRRHRGRCRVAFSARLGSRVWVDDYSVIGPHCVIGARTHICQGVTIGAGTVIGEDCYIHPGVHIYPGMKIGNRVILHAGCIIGDDGFGNSPQPDGSWKKIEHLGNVIIGDDVEIGSNCTVDRAPLESTVIEDGVRLDNLCHIAHGVRVGRNTAMAALCGIAGSTTIGEGCIFAGQVGVNGHISIAPHTIVGGKSAVIGNVRKPGTTIYGNPAIDHRTYLKAYAKFKQAADEE